MFGLIRLLFLLLLCAYFYSWWQLEQTGNDKWRRARKYSLRAAGLLFLLVLIPTVVRRLAL